MFRGVNERIREGAAEAEFAGPTFFVCECGDIACGETIEVRLDEYGHARERTTTFLVAPGHESSDLERVLSDLGRVQAQPPAQRRRRRFVLAVMGGTDMRGRFRLEEELHVVSVMGGTHLDLRNAELTTPEVTVTVLALMGGVNIIVPPGVEVDAHGVLPLMGGRNVRVADALERDAPRIRIRGLVLMGGLNVATRRGRSHGPFPPELPPLP